MWGSISGPFWYRDPVFVFNPSSVGVCVLHEIGLKIERGNPTGIWGTLQELNFHIVAGYKMKNRV